MEVQEASSIGRSIVIRDPKTPEINKNSAPDSSKSQKRKNKILTYPAILISNVMPPTLKPSSKPDSQRCDS